MLEYPSGIKGNTDKVEKNRRDCLYEFYALVGQVSKSGWLRWLQPRTQILPSMRGDYFVRSAGATSGVAYGTSLGSLELCPSALALVRPSE